ncbi:MAG: DUF1579 domain-containing protein [Gemmatimonadetes bacterium]|nr:DUF1579 domain-containing protein [Gemmatimonadota bacterium]
MLNRSLALAGVLLLTAVPAAVWAQGRPDPAALVAAQAEAMDELSFMDGEWRGSAWTFTPSGEKHAIIQTERVGPFLDGSIKVIEGRGYEEDGSIAFNAFAIISYDPADGRYSMRSYAQGRSGDFVVTPTEEGFTWEIPAGPMTIRYEATVRDGTWTEVGDRIAPNQDPIRFFEMTLTREGDTDWPAAAAVAPE